MNYQSTSLWFYSGKVLLAGILFLALALFGISAPLFYILTAGLVIPVVASLRLHGLLEKGVAWQRESTSEWMIYIHGIPVQESRNDLSNPGFFSVDRARHFFLWGFSLKFIVQIAALIALLQQTAYTALPLLIPVLAGLWLLYGAWRTLDALLATFTRKWLLEVVETHSGSQWFHGYYPWRNHAQPALSRLMALL